jgi:hypothetical protein
LLAFRKRKKGFYYFVLLVHRINMRCPKICPLIC